MLSLPKKSTAAAGNNNDLSSICNYADATCSPSAFMCEESPVGDTIKGTTFCSEAFAYRDEAIPFITVNEESSRYRKVAVIFSI